MKYILAYTSEHPKRHIRLIEIKYCEITLHTILLGVGGTVYTAHALDHLEQLGIDPQRSTKLA
eukprot:1138845-Pelagomonas_calceolata.AAC.1